MLDALPVAIYVTDAEGWLTYFNPAAAQLAGRNPALNSDRWCVTWKMFRPDASALAEFDPLLLSKNDPLDHLHGRSDCGSESN
jgi:PAS domain-containing protein